MAIQKIYPFAYTGAVQTWTVPYTGVYKFECWGGQGGDMQAGYTGKGGKGGYAYGEKKLIAGQTIYVYVGGAGIGYYGTSNHYGGWNGGGTCYQGASGGGGGSDVRTTLGDLNTRFIVAGGGGGSNDSTNGGDGGGLTGGIGQNGAGGGTQTTGGSGWINGSFGVGGGAVSSYGDGGAGGGGWYGGGKANGYNSAGGGGSSYISGLSNSGTTSGVNSGNGKITITLLYDNLCFFFEKNGKYTIPLDKYFDTNTKTFTQLTLSQVFQEITSNPTLMYFLNIINGFTINSITYNPFDYIDLKNSKLCVVPIDTRINDVLSEIAFDYLPSSTALSKTGIKVKEFWTPMNEDLNNPYINITGTNLSGANYKLDYYTLKTSASNSCDVMDCEVLKDNFWTSFIFTNPTTVLKSYGVYTIDKVNYTKIKDAYLDISDNYDNTSVTFKNAHTKVLINLIKPASFIYYKETIDTF